MPKIKHVNRPNPNETGLANSAPQGTQCDRCRVTRNSVLFVILKDFNKRTSTCLGCRKFKAIEDAVRVKKRHLGLDSSDDIPDDKKEQMRNQIVEQIEKLVEELQAANLIISKDEKDRVINMIQSHPLLQPRNDSQGHVKDDEDDDDDGDEIDEDKIDDEDVDHADEEMREENQTLEDPNDSHNEVRQWLAQVELRLKLATNADMSLTTQLYDYDDNEGRVRHDNLLPNDPVSTQAREVYENIFQERMQDVSQPAPSNQQNTAVNSGSQLAVRQALVQRPRRPSVVQPALLDLRLQYSRFDQRFRLYIHYLSEMIALCDKAQGYDMQTIEPLFVPDEELNRMRHLTLRMRQVFANGRNR